MYYVPITLVRCLHQEFPDPGVANLLDEHGLAALKLKHKLA